jgi:hypothetical protein
MKFPSPEIVDKMTKYIDEEEQHARVAGEMIHNEVQDPKAALQKANALDSCNDFPCFPLSLPITPLSLLYSSSIPPPSTIHDFGPLTDSSRMFYI